MSVDCWVSQAMCGSIATSSTTIQSLPAAVIEKGIGLDCSMLGLFKTAKADIRELSTPILCKQALTLQLTCFRP